MTLLWICAIQTTVIFLIAIAVLPLLRRRSAALRHWVLASALVFAAATPAFNLVMPSWSVPQSLARVIPRPQTSIARHDIREAAAPPLAIRAEVVSAAAPQGETRFTPRQIAIGAIGIWVTGVLSGLVFLGIGLIRLRRLASRSTPIAGVWRELGEQISLDYRLPRPVRLLHSQNPSVLVTWGVIRPEVLLPRGADAWPSDIVTVVLRHELAHVCRRDWVVQMLAQSLRIIYWFNPLTWIVCRRLRLEAELACDDAVLVRDIIGHEYASHLLGLARSLNTTDRAWSAVLTMARPSTLERRFAAMLNPHLNRNPLTRSAVIVTLLVGLCITASLPAMKTLAAEPPPVPPVQARVQPAEPAPAPAVAPIPPAQRPPGTIRTGELPKNEPELNKALEQLVAEASKIPGTIQNDAASLGAVIPFAWPGSPSAESVEMLIKLFDGSNDTETKEHILGYLGMSNNPKAVEKVLAIARSTADKEMQEHAIGFIAMRPNAFDELVSLFDASTNAETRRVILDQIGMSSDRRATQKLFAIAQSDPNPELRRAAVDYIAFR